jgi:MoaA/NifB/PqqE/SkfB family radical SAM enzyme
VPERITDLYIKNQRKIRPNLDISHRCILRCPQCIRQKTSSQDQIRRSFDLDEKDFKKILDYYPSITFCGQISDPIYHPNFLNFLKMCDDRGTKVRIATNGSGHPVDWWKEAFSYTRETTAWYFGVDGIDEKSEIYRIGSNFANVWEMMKLGRDMGHNIVWQYIIFGYNEHEIDRAIEIAQEEQFSIVFVNTNRGFNANHPGLRKNVDYQITKPNEKFIEERVKKEWWGHKTEPFKEWQMRGVE